MDDDILVVRAFEVRFPVLFSRPPHLLDTFLFLDTSCSWIFHHGVMDPYILIIPNFKYRQAQPTTKPIYSLPPGAVRRHFSLITPIMLVTFDLGFESW